MLVHRADRAPTPQGVLKSRGVAMSARTCQPAAASLSGGQTCSPGPGGRSGASCPGFCGPSCPPPDPLAGPGGTLAAWAAPADASIIHKNSSFELYDRNQDGPQFERLNNEVHELQQHTIIACRRPVHGLACWGSLLEGCLKQAGGPAALGTLEAAGRATLPAASGISRAGWAFGAPRAGSPCCRAATAKWLGGCRCMHGSGGGNDQGDRIKLASAEDLPDILHCAPATGWSARSGMPLSSQPPHAVCPACRVEAVLVKA